MGVSFQSGGADILVTRIEPLVPRIQNGRVMVSDVFLTGTDLLTTGHPKIENKSAKKSEEMRHT
jgi:hypothetical protein